MRAHLKTFVWLGLAVVVGVVLYRTQPWKPSTHDEAAAYQTSAVDRGPIVSKVTASGTLSALVTVQVGSQVSGRIREIRADFNSVVKKGEVIARLDPQLLSAALEQARANYAAAQADLLKAKVQAKDADRQLARQQSLNDRKLTAQADFDTAQANAEIAQAQVAAAQGRLAQTRAALHQAEVNLDYATITSPIDGVVISRDVDVGQTVTASLQTPTLFVIAEDLRKMQVDTSVAEADVGKLEAGMPAYFTVDAYPTQRFEGSVRQIRNAAQTVQNVVTYDAVIDVQNPDLRLRPGMTANVTFVYARQPNALRVANAALRFKPPAELLVGPAGDPAADTRAGADARPAAPTLSSQRPAAPTLSSQRPAAPTLSAPQRGRVASNTGRRLWLLRDGKPVQVTVQTGITDGTHTEIIEGPVREGDRAITDVTGASAGPRPGARPGFRRIL